MTAAFRNCIFRLVLQAALCTVTTEIQCVLGCVGEVKQEDMTPLTRTLHLLTAAVKCNECGVMM